jgi:ubiquinone/menaquinone biosynthesis C-methylase UbiE
MSIPSQSSNKHLSTFILPASSNEDERIHLQLQDDLIISGMGGTLPEQVDTTNLQHVLDIGCNSGSWLLETAKTYPHIAHLVGLNISQPIVESLNKQITEQQISDRITFHYLSALGSLEFLDDQFDLVNIQLGQSFLRTWDWSRLIQEIRRITRPGGILRITEMNFFEGSSSALEQHRQLVEQTLYQAGHRFVPYNQECAPELIPLLQRNGVQQIQTRPYRLHYRAGTPEGDLIIGKIAYSYRNMRPFLQKWTRLPPDYEERYQQLLKEMQRPDFIAVWPLTTIWGSITPG